MLASPRKACLSVAVATVLALAPTAQADELADVQSLQADIEAAGELVAAATDTDWGVPDLSTPAPAVAEGAPAVPAVAEQAAEPARYQLQEAQYHAEYQLPDANPTPPPRPAQAPASGWEPQPAEAGAQAPEPSQPAPQTQPQPSATPTIWIWVWNWNWVSDPMGGYRNFNDQYQFEGSILDKEVARIIRETGVQVPVQIGVANAGDIADDIVTEALADETTPPSAVAGAQPAASTPSRAAARPVRLVRHPQPRAAVERTVQTSPLALSSTPESGPRPARTHRHAKQVKPPRVRDSTRQASPTPLPGERVTDAAASGGGSASFFKTVAILALSLLLAAFGHGRRIWLPAARWRGLLGTRTDPPG